MSSALYLVRLMYHGGRGDMGYHGVHIDLIERPAVMVQLGLIEVEFTPEVRVARVRERTIDRWREMTTAEREEISAWLQSKAAAVRAVISDDRKGPLP